MRSQFTFRRRKPRDDQLFFQRRTLIRFMNYIITDLSISKFRFHRQIGLG